MPKKGPTIISMDNNQVSTVARAFFAAFQQQDHTTAESLLSDKFTFTSPRDNHISKAQYFERCWPNSDKLGDFQIEQLFVQGDDAFVRYSALRKADRVRFRNIEFFQTDRGQIKKIEVYFGRDLD